MVSDLIDQHPERFAVVSFNVDDAFEVPWGKSRFVDFYSLAFTPKLMFDGELNCPSADYATCLGQRLNTETDVTLSLSATQVSGPTWNVEAKVCNENAGATRALRVYTAATLSHRDGLPPYSRNVLMQHALTEDVSLTGGGCQTVTSRVTFDDESWAHQNDIAIISWAQEPATTGPAAVHQAAVMTWPFSQPPELTTIGISPSFAIVDLGESRNFTATGQDQNGANFPLSNPVWSMTGTGEGTLSPTSGSATTRFFATRRGDLQLTCSNGSVSGMASVVIQGDPPHLASITLDPDSVTLAVGRTQTFSATGIDQYGDPFTLNNPTWDVDGTGDGTFDPPTGNATTIFTATVIGSAIIVIRQDGLEASAPIEITEQGLPKPRRVRTRHAP